MEYYPRIILLSFYFSFEEDTITLFVLKKEKKIKPQEWLVPIRVIFLFLVAYKQYRPMGVDTILVSDASDQDNDR